MTMYSLAVIRGANRKVNYWKEGPFSHRIGENTTLFVDKKLAEHT